MARAVVAALLAWAVGSCGTEPAGAEPAAGDPAVAEGPAAAEAASDSTIWQEGTLAFVREVDARYPFFDLKGIRGDWEACKRSLLEKVENCRSNEAFYTLLAEAKRCLRDGHMGFLDLKGEYPKPAVRYTPGVSFLPAADGQVVVLNAAPEYADVLTPGTVVTKIEGADAREFLEREAKEKWTAGGSFSSPQRARLYAYRIPLQAEQGERREIQVLKDNEPTTVQLTCTWEAIGYPHTYAMPEGLARHGSCLYGKIEGKHGYIYLRRIDRLVIEAIDRAFSSFQGIRGLIVDLRGNGGGGYSSDLVRRFDRRKGPLPGAPLYRGDVVVLIDAGTISAGETLARDLVYAAGARLMGSRTAGSSTAKYSWKLPHDLGTVQFSARSRWGFDRQPIEYHGIAPHEPIEVVPAELQQGINSGIRRAQEYLDEKWEQRDAAAAEPILVLPQGGFTAENHVKARFRHADSGGGRSIVGTVKGESGRLLEQVKISNWNPGGSAPYVTHTDAEGQFHLPGKEAWYARVSYAVSADKAGFAPAFYEFRDEYLRMGQDMTLELEFTLTDGCTIQGTIASRADGEPIPEASVWIERLGNDVDVGLDRYIIWRSDPILTDGQGHFRLVHVPDGSLRIHAEAQGFVEASSNYRPVDDKTTERIDLQLRPMTPDEILEQKAIEAKRRDLSLDGIVTDEAGQPIQGVKVSHYFPNGMEPRVTYTDAQGAFRFEKHWGYVVIAEEEGHAPLFHEFRDKYFEEYHLSGTPYHPRTDFRGPIHVRLTLSKGAVVAGRALSSQSNEPIAGARVWLERWAKDPDVGLMPYVIWKSEPVKTDPEGRFVFNHVPVGRLTIRADPQGCPSETSNEFEIEDGGHFDVDLHLDL